MSSHVFYKNLSSAKPGLPSRHIINALPVADYMKRYKSLVNFVEGLTNDESDDPASKDDSLVQRLRKAAIRERLREVGLTKFDVSLLEPRKLHVFLHESEKIQAAITGWLPGGGFAMITATSKRLIWLKIRPFFSAMDDISYEQVGAISYSSNKWYASITLHTRTGDYRLNFVTFAAARNFVDYIESKSLASGKGMYLQPPPDVVPP